MPSQESSAIVHLGRLTELPSKAGDTKLPVVEATILTGLVPCAKKARGDTRLQPISVEQTDTNQPRIRPAKKPNDPAQRLYYVCTMRGCHWSGTGRKRHSKARPKCTGVPCCFVPQGPLKDEVKRFLSRCTKEQVSTVNIVRMRRGFTLRALDRRSTMAFPQMASSQCP